MRHVPVAQARDEFETLARLVEAGERVVVTRDGEPVLELVACARKRGGVNFAAIREYKRKHGIDTFFPEVPDDFDAPLPEDFLLRPLPE